MHQKLGGSTFSFPFSSRHARSLSGCTASVKRIRAASPFLLAGSLLPVSCQRKTSCVLFSFFSFSLTPLFPLCFLGRPGPFSLLSLPVSCDTHMEDNSFLQQLADAEPLGEVRRFGRDPQPLASQTIP